jgi:hypothetical protein
MAGSIACSTALTGAGGGVQPAGFGFLPDIANGVRLASTGTSAATAAINTNQMVVIYADAASIWVTWGTAPVATVGTAAGSIPLVANVPFIMPWTTGNKLAAIGTGNVILYPLL